MALKASSQAKARFVYFVVQRVILARQKKDIKTYRYIVGVVTWGDLTFEDCTNECIYNKA